MTIAIPLNKFDFYPDKPKETSLSCLEKFDNGKYLAVSKLDGWNLFMCNDGNKIECYSRTWKEIPVSDRLRKSWSKLAKDNKIPDRSIINCEWMKMRAGKTGDNDKYDGPEMIYLLTPYVMKGLFIGYRPYNERRKWLEDLGLPTDDLSTCNSSDLFYDLVLPAKAESNFVDFFNKNKGVYRTEGIVLCRKNGTLIGNQNSSIKTKEMLKLKWRKGDDGRTEYLS